MKTTTPQKIENMTKNRASVDTRTGNIFWEMMPFSKTQKAADDLASLSRESPRSLPELPNWPSIIEDLSERCKSLLRVNDLEGFTKTLKQLNEAQERYRLAYGRRAPKPETPIPDPRTSINGIRAYWALKNGKRASAKITFRKQIPESNALEGIQMYMSGKKIAETIQGVRSSGSSFDFGYWADEQSFIKNDYSAFLPENYPGIFKVASNKIVAQYGGSYYYEVRLSEA